MCGIAGICAAEGTDASRTAAERMVAALHHRGPDDRGFHFSGPLAMGMTRLSIVDLAGGHQPISNEDGSVSLVCNGEIYNHDELRRELMALGHVFKTRSDVEVIVHLYEEHGIAFIERLRGMFAFALWDERARRLVIARDRLGIKPLFYAIANQRLLFGSEIKALLGAEMLSRQVDVEALDEYLSFGYIPAPRTIYAQIQKLEPGHVLIWADGRATFHRYWRLRFTPNTHATEAELSQRFLELFDSAVRSHLMSDVSLGAFLSGGVDSSLVVALMSRHSAAAVRTFTIGFGATDGGYLDERPFARQVSHRYKTIHREFEIQPRLDEVLDEIAGAFDEPFADDSVIPTHYICKYARPHVTVALTGLGGDELFGGYERYLGLKLSAFYERLPAFLRTRVLPRLINALPERRDGHYTVNHLKRFVRSSGLPPSERYLNYVTVFNETLKRQVCTPEAFAGMRNHDAARQFFDAAGVDDLLDKALYHDMHTYLPEDILALTDRLSMHHGLELRVPFLDHPMVEFCATIPASLKIRYATKKYLLKQTAQPLVPHGVLHHRKQGFASPMAAWLRGDLRRCVLDSLSAKRLAKHGFFRPDAVEGLMAAHMSRRESNDRQLFTLLMFQKWYERCM